MPDPIKLLSRWKEVILITATVHLGLFILPLFVRKDLTNIFYPWVQWDGPHYIDIAKNWYQSQGEQALWIVFYPLYPILIKIFNFLIGDFLVSAVIVSIFFSFTASILLFELTLLDFDRKVAFLSVWFLNIFPTSYFLQASYVESVFLTVSISTIYFIRKNKSIAGIFGLLSSMTRINGILLLPVIFMESKLKIKNLIALLLTPVGFIFYLVINYLTFGSFLYFTKPLESNWYKRADLSWNGLRDLISSIPSYDDVLFYTYISELIALVVLFSLSIYVFLRVRKSYGVYMFLNFLLLTSTSFIMSTPRYLLAVFPIFIALGSIKNRILLWIISIIFIILLIYFSKLYTGGQWAF